MSLNDGSDTKLLDSGRTVQNNLMKKVPRLRDHCYLVDE